MSRLFGPAMQNGVVVPDLDVALTYWTTEMGAGPFFRTDNLRNEYYVFEGREVASPHMSVALGNWGNLQIELICPHGDGDSTWHRFLQGTGGGVHHVSVWSTSYDDHVKLAHGLGMREDCRGKLPKGPRYTYFGSGVAGQPLLEIAELTPSLARLYERVREASLDWRGEDPVRTP
ncbi:VOC family protein [Novosphingobium sp. PASSN1]|uniref:VOC family protein n=1 Tax=Novosphingobium sp. PASSN1 TaxID=2015561 RepID=UPI000BCE9ABB|nr:VOC family protein [Novosphingobium sp. PASSN1]OYU35720.1 MAG: hypothetical protein CFE35_09500 [Novosphingobium sp. PASSN1]